MIFSLPELMPLSRIIVNRMATGTSVMPEVQFDPLVSLLVTFRRNHNQMTQCCCCCCHFSFLALVAQKHDFFNNFSYFLDLRHRFEGLVAPLSIISCFAVIRLLSIARKKINYACCSYVLHSVEFKPTQASTQRILSPTP